MPFCETVIPVDIVAKSIIGLSTQAGVKGQTYHLNGWQLLNWNDVIHSFTELKPLAVSQWFKMAEQAALGEKSIPIAPYLFMFNNVSIEKQLRQQYEIDQSWTEEALRELNINIKAFDESIQKKYLLGIGKLVNSENTVELQCSDCESTSDINLSSVKNNQVEWVKE